MTGFPGIKPRFVNVPLFAEEALWQELELTPKPGLVDRLNSGSHDDMDYALFGRSISAIAPWFRQFELLGYEHAAQPDEVQLSLLRPMGIACERSMYAATGGINTHKGAIFALGLLCFAAGRLRGQQRPLIVQLLCRQVSDICRGLVARELAMERPASTAGERQYRRFALTGARGEAESGFATVRKYILPDWYQEKGAAHLHYVLLKLMAVNPDSNLVSRGGIDGLHYVQHYASRLLQGGWETRDLFEMDRCLIARRLSPGGSADLLSVAIVLGALLR